MEQGNYNRFSEFSAAEQAVIREALAVHEPRELGRNRSITALLLVELGPTERKTVLSNGEIATDYYSADGRWTHRHVATGRPSAALPVVSVSGEVA